MRIVFMGTPEFAVPSLEMLIKEGYNIVGVITQTDKPKGRGERLCCPPVKEVALKNNLNVLQPDSVKTQEFLEQLKTLKPDVMITVAYGKILPQQVLDIPVYGTVNVHASLLPLLRGAAPIHHALINGFTVTGITTMMTDRGMDTGDILLSEEIPVHDRMNVGELHDILAELGAKVLKETLEKLNEGTLKRIPQDHSKATYAPMVDKETGRIDWNKPAIDIHNRIRGVTPWPGAYTFYEGKRMKLIQSYYTDRITDAEPGTLLEVTKDYIEIAANPGTVMIYEIQFENCRCMPIGVCGHNLEKGIVLKPYGNNSKGGVSCVL